MKLNVVLFQPEIPQNTGNIMRTCVGVGAKLHLIKPLGFLLDEKHLRRSAVDYYEYIEYEVYEDYEDFLNEIIKKFNTAPKKIYYRVQVLSTTIYNYKELSKLYKEQVQLGYSKMLPQIALGHSQSAIINTAYFENEVLHLSEIMIPPLMSSTLSGEDILGNKGQSGSSKSQNTIGNSSSTVKADTSEKSSGRPEKADSEKSEKTIANKESMS